MLRSLRDSLTVRGRSFVLAGLTGVVAGLLAGSHPLTSVGALLLALPVLSAMTAHRTRYQLRCERTLSPGRVAPGRPARVTLRLENLSKLPTGLMLAEDSVPYALGARPRYVLNGIERGGTRDLSYQLRSDLRGKFAIGPLTIRIADVFGLVELTGAVAAPASLTVTPRVLQLSGDLATGSWAGDGDGRSRVITAAGDDDVVPRPYRDGDELRRVHWRSTARHGELMVRREEQRWKNRAYLLLDTRRTAHAGVGATSSFEAAVSTAASIGVHLARAGLGGLLVSDAGPLAGPGMFEDVMLDVLSVISPSQHTDFHRAMATLGAAEGGLLVVVAGRMSPQAARQLAACRREGSQGLAILLDVANWARDGRGAEAAAAAAAGQEPAIGEPAIGAPAIGAAAIGAPAIGAAAIGAPAIGAAAISAAAISAASARRPARPARESTAAAAAAAVFRAAGWRVATLDSGAGIGAAWRSLGTPDARGPAAAPPGSDSRGWRPAVVR